MCYLYTYKEYYFTVIVRLQKGFVSCVACNSTGDWMVSCAMLILLNNLIALGLGLWWYGFTMCVSHVLADQSRHPTNAQRGDYPGLVV